MHLLTEYARIIEWQDARVKAKAPPPERRLASCCALVPFALDIGRQLDDTVAWEDASLIVSSSRALSNRMQARTALAAARDELTHAPALIPLVTHIHTIPYHPIPWKNQGAAPLDPVGRALSRPTDGRRVALPGLARALHRGSV